MFTHKVEINGSFKNITEQQKAILSKALFDPMTKRVEVSGEMYKTACIGNILRLTSQEKEKANKPVKRFTALPRGRDEYDIALEKAQTAVGLFFELDPEDREDCFEAFEKEHGVGTTERVIMKFIYEKENQSGSLGQFFSGRKKTVNEGVKNGEEYEVMPMSLAEYFISYKT